MATSTAAHLAPEQEEAETHIEHKVKSILIILEILL